MTGSSIRAWPPCKAWAAHILAEAAEPIIESLMVGGLKVPSDPIANALVRCFMDQPDGVAALSSPLPGRIARPCWRAWPANSPQPPWPMKWSCWRPTRGPKSGRPQQRRWPLRPLPLAIPALADLARDEVWFVRLRATTALNEIPHPRTIPILLEAVRDSNRLVRIRAASALSKFQQETVEILQSIVDSRDRYALHAMISALELGGGFGKVMAELADPLLHDQTAEQLARCHPRRRRRPVEHTPRRSSGGICVSVSFGLPRIPVHGIRFSRETKVLSQSEVIASHESRFTNHESLSALRSERRSIPSCWHFL